MQDVKQSKPISSSWFTKKEPAEPVINRDHSVETDDDDDETPYKHTIAAIAAITEEDIEFFTPPEPAEDELEEETTEPVFIEATPTMFIGRSTARPSIVVNDNTFLRTLGASGARRGSYQITSRRSSLHPKLVRSSTLANFQLMQQGGVFGSNKDNVERILKRMANAIQMDLGRQ